MGTNYATLAELMRYLGSLDRNRLAWLTDIRDGAQVTQEELFGTLDELDRRKWLTWGGARQTVGLCGQAWNHAGKSPAQLLGFDVATWAQARGVSTIRTAELPPELQSNARLIDAAFADMETGGAVKTHRQMRGGPGPEVDVAWVQNGLPDYLFRGGGDQAPVVFQHFGDNVCRDKNVNTGSGVIATGDGATVTINADAAENFRLFVDALRIQGEVNAEALDLLAEIARADVNRHEVTGVVTEAVKLEPRLFDKVNSWLSSASDQLLKTGLVEGLKLYIAAHSGHSRQHP